VNDFEEYNMGVYIASLKTRVEKLEEALRNIEADAKQGVGVYWNGDATVPTREARIVEICQAALSTRKTS
jgi:hypothetical protein